MSIVASNKIPTTVSIVLDYDLVKKPSKKQCATISHRGMPYSVHQAHDLSQGMRADYFKYNPNGSGLRWVDVAELVSKLPMASFSHDDLRKHLTSVFNNDLTDLDFLPSVLKKLEDTYGLGCWYTYMKTANVHCIQDDRLHIIYAVDVPKLLLDLAIGCGLAENLARIVDYAHLLPATIVDYVEDLLNYGLVINKGCTTLSVVANRDNIAAAYSNPGELQQYFMPKKHWVSCLIHRTESALPKFKESLEAAYQQPQFSLPRELAGDYIKPSPALKAAALDDGHICDLGMLFNTATSEVWVVMDINRYAFFLRNTTDLMFKDQFLVQQNLEL